APLTQRLTELGAAARRDHTLSRHSRTLAHASEPGPVDPNIWTRALPSGSIRSYPGRACDLGESTAPDATERNGFDRASACSQGGDTGSHPIGTTLRSRPLTARVVAGIHWPAVP